MKRALLFIAMLIVTAQSVFADTGGGYLFAHMLKQDYGRLYYSVSKDGLNWQLLNDGKRICEDYKGHPDICRAPDGKFYMTGGSGSITLWVSPDLVTWSKHSEIQPDVYKTPNFKPQERTYGASKIYYDKDSRLFLITWHTSQHKQVRERPEHYWAGQRTLYITSKDLRTFTQPKRLFQYDMATIDVIIRKDNDRYFAFMKDERDPSFDWPTGKSIRIASSQNLTGPWTEPSPRVTANFREAPTLIPIPGNKGWYLYYEQYPGIQYGCSAARTLAGPWHEIYVMRHKIPPSARHGCMIPITQTEYDHLIQAYRRQITETQEAVRSSDSP